MNMKVPMSPGEVLDRLTILQLKCDRIRDNKKREAAQREWSLLQQVWTDHPVASAYPSSIIAPWESLAACNERLWILEDEVRDPKVRTNKDLLASIYLCITTENDLRASLKAEINKLLGATEGEVKEHGTANR